MNIHDADPSFIGMVRSIPLQTPAARVKPRTAPAPPSQPTDQVPFRLQRGTRASSISAAREMRPLLYGCRIARWAGGDAPGGQEPCQEPLGFAGLHGRQALAAQPMGMGFCGRRAKDIGFVLHVPRPMTKRK